MCLALLLAIGFAVPYMIAVIWLAEVRREFQSDKESLPIESLIVASDGTPLIRSYSYPTLRHEYRTLDGQPAPADSEQGAMYSSALFGEAGRIGIAYQKGWDGRIYAFADASSSPAYWYFVVVDNAEEGRGFFEGYDAGSRQRVGYLGVNGFTTTRPAHEQQFPVYATGLSYIGTMFNSGPFQNGLVTRIRGWFSEGKAVFVRQFRVICAVEWPCDFDVQIAEGFWGMFSAPK
ncbi:MAG: hypothetical protein EXS05_17285, partial [Planctomycetaceae bacterium]|nr:hypothetical protein [Planctomycetaceae bacterium]